MLHGAPHSDRLLYPRYLLVTLRAGSAGGPGSSWKWPGTQREPGLWNSHWEFWLEERNCPRMELCKPGIPPKEEVIGMHPSPTRLPPYLRGLRGMREADAWTSAGRMRYSMGGGWSGWERRKLVHSPRGESEHSALLLTSGLCLWDSL